MSFLNYLASRWDHLLELAIAHAEVVFISLLIATVIGVTTGVLVYRRERTAEVVLAVTSTFLTIPSFALFGLLLPIFGLGWLPTIFALVVYALLPIVRNTIVGLRSVDPAIAESAQGMGMSRWSRLFRIELPLAWPVIITGLRVSTLIIVGIAAIAAYVNGPGLGEDIFQGISRIGSAVALNLVLGAVLAIILLALLFDGFFALLGKLTTSRGLHDR
ncbi:MAG: ABC transporter, permease protein (cluster 13, osmolytes) [uncultured Rubrobacteraceae bacterium]|uniref:ABC transporter, permease protein (Cluster 13, osmolytes) n=1 Tax=uncultured Rubrobacteraceae bacterium TaxID=349277 RepID=A0A6J4Q6X1_9ACTN|nr:MAG: ABC transporter, permease protein (cluster 13, osmolytes) [uncultured Rubrobacteraceae bacterium]